VVLLSFFDFAGSCSKPKSEIAKLKEEPQIRRICGSSFFFGFPGFGFSLVRHLVPCPSLRTNRIPSSIGDGVFPLRVVPDALHHGFARAVILVTQEPFRFCCQ
jgi:hypothetical protein